MKVLPPSFFQRATPVVAHDMIGCILEHVVSETDVRSLRIVETEAYLAEDDAACHASTRRTKRNEAMFDTGGVLYVYLIYGMHHCANIVTEHADRGCAVLLRAGEVTDGDDRIASGPGKLAKFMGLTPTLNHASVYEGAVRVYEDAQTRAYRDDIIVTTRIGITKDVELPLRFYAAHSNAVSRKPRGLPMQVITHK